jgi:hypothetical protein
LDRRRFVSLSAAAAANAALPGIGNTQSKATVHIKNPVAPAKLMPLDFTGLSYETGQLYNSEYFSPQNTALIAAFRGLSNHGVLRLGGHLSNITPWEGVGQDDPKQVRGVRHGIEDYWEWPLVDPVVQHHKQGMITHQAIKNLKGFLDAVNWRLIYGLNFACGNTARAADEAAAVATIMNDRLIAFVVGNEADGFGEDPFFRPRGYNFDQYIAEYEAWVKAVRARVPHAPFAGPDTEGHVDTWVAKFGERTKGDAVMLTSHFYAMGPASDPAMTAERLLQKVNPLLEEQIAAVKSAVAASGTPYRMDEGNSCFGGGKDGVSNAYASALWVADYMLHVACAGFIGVNLHGGGTGFYAPIESSEKSSAAPRPMYYGMQFAQQLAGYELAPCVLNTGENITAYLATKGKETQLALFNKGADPIRVTLSKDLLNKPMKQRSVLRGPGLNAREGVRFIKEPEAEATSFDAIPGYSAVLLRTL